MHYVDVISGKMTVWKGKLTAVVAILILLTSCAKHVGTVRNVIDGDTVVLNNGKKVRLIGIDTPEIHSGQKLNRDAKRTNKPVAEIKKLGLVAKQFTERLLGGKKVIIEYDDRIKDRYGRTLGYLYLNDGTFINEEIIRQGYGVAYIRYPFKYMNRFRAAEKEAREAQRGLWADGGAT